MKMKHLKITAAAAAVLLIMLILLPVPLRAHLTITPSSPEEALDFSFSAPVLSRNGISRTAPSRYSALRNEYAAATLVFTDNFDRILYTDETMEDSVYAAGRDGDPAAVIEYLSR